MKQPNIAPFFGCLYPGLCDIARLNGYALAIHGSMVTDLDLIACPWTEKAIDAKALMILLTEHIGAVDYRGMLKRDCDWANDEQIEQMVEGDRKTWRYSVGPDGEELKPHGRKAWNLYLDCGVKIDLSVMPKIYETESTK